MFTVLEALSDAPRAFNDLPEGGEATNAQGHAFLPTTALSRQTPKAGALCGNFARRNLCGGQG